MTIEIEDSTVWKGPTINDITRYVLPRKAGAPLVHISKNQNYTVKMPETPRRVHVMMDIVPKFQKLQYNDHDVLVYLPGEALNQQRTKIVGIGTTSV